MNIEEKYLNEAVVDEQGYVSVTKIKGIGFKVFKSCSSCSHYNDSESEFVYVCTNKIVKKIAKKEGYRGQIEITDSGVCKYYER